MIMSNWVWVTRNLVTMRAGEPYCHTVNKSFARCSHMCFHRWKCLNMYAFNDIYLFTLKYVMYIHVFGCRQKHCLMCALFFIHITYKIFHILKRSAHYFIFYWLFSLLTREYLRLSYARNVANWQLNCMMCLLSD